VLNALMNRPPEAPLGPPAELQPATAAPEQARPPADRRPEVDVAAASLRRSEAELDLARRERVWPSVTVGADYMYMPVMEHPHAYGAMVMLNLPWLSPGRSDAVRAAESSLAADRHALQAVRNVVQYELQEARARHEAARASFQIIERDLLPLARRNFEAAYASYAAGQGDAIALIDALRSSLELGIDRVRALVRLAIAAADLTRASGEQEDRP
jgi:outer membrane protein TolC